MLQKNRADIEIRVANSSVDKEHLVSLRDRVYVQEQGRLARAEDMTRIFGKYEEFSTYFIAYRDGRAVGSVKVTTDSVAGLPCEHAVDLAALRKNHALVELGHWICLPELRVKGAGMLLMREALTFSVVELKATHILADIFLEVASSAKMKFYRLLGFMPLCDVYYDTRFDGNPASTIVVLETQEVLNRRERKRNIKKLRGGFSPMKLETEHTS